MNTIEVVANQRMLCIMPTFQCTAECAHCGTFSNPRETTWLSLEEHLLPSIRQAREMGYGGVVFSGGEPTLAGASLLQAMREAALFGLRTRLITNAYWATGEGAASQRIKDFVGAGLSEIQFSTGDQHVRFVPLDNVFHATEAAVDAGLGIAISVETVRQSQLTKQAIEEHPNFKRICLKYPHSSIAVIEWTWSRISPFTVEEYREGTTINKSNLATRAGCDDLFSTTTIQADGTISPCCGLGIRAIPELRVGNIRDMSLANADHIAASDALKQRIRTEGPERILAWASTYDPEIEWENLYAHRCQACIRLYKDPRVQKVIAEHAVSG